MGWCVCLCLLVVLMLYGWCEECQECEQYELYGFGVGWCCSVVVVGLVVYIFFYCGCGVCFGVCVSGGFECVFRGFDGIGCRLIDGFDCWFIVRLNCGLICGLIVWFNCGLACGFIVWLVCGLICGLIVRFVCGFIVWFCGGFAVRFYDCIVVCDF